MKHTILLATASHVNLISLLDRVEALLHKSYQRIYKVFYLNELHEKGVVATGAGSENPIDQLVSKVENELMVEKYAQEHGYSVDLLGSTKDDHTLISQSTVADLLIVDVSRFMGDMPESSSGTMLEKVSCPVFFLPEDTEIKCFVAVQDGSRTSIKMMKSFVELFDPDLMKLPISILMSEPQTKLQMKNETVFVNYLKLYFKNLGAQHLYDDVLPSLFRYIQKECEEPMLLVNDGVADDIVESTESLDTYILSHPIFIFKD